MPFIIGGAVLGGALLSSNAAQGAASTQAGAAGHAADVQKEMFDIINSQQAPYRQAGVQALNQLQNFTGNRVSQPATASTAATDPTFRAMGPVMFADQGQPQTFAPDVPVSTNQQVLGAEDPNSLLHRFNANDLTANLAPNWQFSLEQGQGATRNLANATGGLLSGNTLKGIADYTLNKSGDLYQQAFQNFTSNQSNIFNRLASIAGIGQTANQATASAGVPIAGAIGQAGMGGAAAAAAGRVGSANAFSSGISNAAGWYGINNLLNPSQGSTLSDPSFNDPLAYG
jgi:hypothetical protein